MYEALTPTRWVVSHEQEQIKCPWITLLPWKVAGSESHSFHLLSFKTEEAIPSEIGWLYCRGKKKSKNSETLSRDDVLWNPRGEKKGWKRTQRRVSWLKRSRTIRLIGLARWRCKGTAGVKATKASPRRGKWVHYNQQESRDGICGGLNEQRPDLTAVRGTVGWAKVNKSTSNTTRRDAARKRPSVIVGGSGMMWLSTLCMIVFNVGRFSAPEPDDETHLLMNPRSQSQDSVNFGINAMYMYIFVKTKVRL